MSTNYGTLINYTTKQEISPANRTQLAHALNAKPLGIILVGGVRCVVIPPPAGSQGLLEACTDNGTGVDA